MCVFVAWVVGMLVGVFMCACMYSMMRACANPYAFTYIVNELIETCSNICRHARLCACAGVHVCTRMCMHVCVFMCVQLCVCMQARVYMRASKSIAE